VSRCLANRLLLVRYYSGFQVVFIEMLPNKQWLEHLIHTPLYKRYKTEINPAFLNADNVPTDTYELDEINQSFQR
jgi:hypothetical protein